MKREDYIESQVGRKTPFEVPEGYMDSFTERMMASLPEYPEVPKVPELSLWHKIRPYVYMAAMFAGIWCMMRMFHTMTNPETSLDSAPEHIAAVMANPADYDAGYLTDFADDYDLEADVTENYDSFDDLRADLGITLSPNYN